VLAQISAPGTVAGSYTLPTGAVLQSGTAPRMNLTIDTTAPPAVIDPNADVTGLDAPLSARKRVAMRQPSVVTSRMVPRSEIAIHPQALRLV